jgi:hypothetical protein
MNQKLEQLLFTYILEYNSIGRVSALHVESYWFKSNYFKSDSLAYFAKHTLVFFSIKCLTLFVNVNQISTFDSFLVKKVESEKTIDNWMSGLYRLF